MALVFCDGFDHYETLDILRKWTTAVAWTPLFGGIQTDGGIVGAAWARPPGGQGLHLANTTRRLKKTLSASQATFVFGAYVYFEGSFADAGFVYFWDGGGEQCSLRVDSAGHLIVSRDGTTLATSTNVFSANTWYHIEAKITIHNTTGAYEVRVNGTSTNWIPAATSKNTRAQTNNYITELSLGCHNNTGTRWDDVYFLSSASPNNDFVGPQKILTLYPCGVGNYAQWTPNYANNHQNVAETQCDADATFNQSATANQIDSFAFDDVPTATVTAVQHVLVARQDAGAQRVIAPFERTGGSDYVGSSFNTAGSYVAYLDPKDVDPATSAAWTNSGISACEFGYKLIS